MTVFNYIIAVGIGAIAAGFALMWWGEINDDLRVGNEQDERESGPWWF